MTKKSKQEQIQEMLQNCGLSAYEIKVFGTKVLIDTVNPNNVEQWRRLLGSIAVLDEAQTIHRYPKKRKGDFYQPEAVKVFRLIGTLKGAPV